MGMMRVGLGWSGVGLIVMGVERVGVELGVYMVVGGEVSGYGQG